MKNNLKTQNEFYPQQSKLFILVGLAVFILSIAFWLGQQSLGPNFEVINFKHLTFSALFTLAGIIFLWTSLKKLQNHQPSLVISDKGFIDNISLSSVGLIEWQEVESIQLSFLNINQILVFTFKDPKKVKRQLSLFQRVLILGNKSKVKGDTFIPQAMLDQPIEQIYQQIDNFKNS